MKGKKKGITIVTLDEKIIIDDPYNYFVPKRNLLNPNASMIHGK